MRPGNAAMPVRPNPPANCVAVSPRGSSSSASGLPWHSETICSHTAASRGPCKLLSSSARASFAGSPSTISAGCPAKMWSPMPVRAAHASATRSARRRRATNPMICADIWSSHCASSTMHISGCRSATSANRVSTAKRPRIDPAQARCPGRTLSPTRRVAGREAG